MPEVPGILPILGVLQGHLRLFPGTLHPAPKIQKYEIFYLSYSERETGISHPLIVPQ